MHGSLPKEFPVGFDRNGSQIFLKWFK